MSLTHKEARRKLGSRSVRRSGISARRGKGGIVRKAGKARVAVSVRKLMREANGG